MNKEDDKERLGAIRTREAMLPYINSDTYPNKFFKSKINKILK